MLSEMRGAVLNESNYSQVGKSLRQRVFKLKIVLGSKGLKSEIRQFGQDYTGYLDGETCYLILDMSRNIGQPVKFYFRGGAREPPSNG